MGESHAKICAESYILLHLDFGAVDNGSMQAGTNMVGPFGCMGIRITMWDGEQ